MQKIIIFLLIFFHFTSLQSQEEYFLTLRHEMVNLRQGPSFDYPVKIYYKKKFLPVLIQDKSDNFRKIRDHENNSGWIHISQLSKKKAAIIIDEKSLIYSKNTIYSKPLAITEVGRLLLIRKCKNEWCKIQSKKIKGWIKRTHLWGNLD